MSRSFDRLIEFFSLDQREKEKKVEEIFQETLEFFKYFKHVQAEGSDEEKKNVKEKLVQLQERFKQEAHNTLSDVNLSQEDVVEITSKEENFNEKQWGFIQSVKKVFNEQKEDFTKLKKVHTRSSLDKLKNAKKVKRRISSKSWLKS
jgi:hypothetical protein